MYDPLISFSWKQSNIIFIIIIKLSIIDLLPL